MSAASAAISQVGKAEFDEQVLRSSVPVLVDFFATWCAPCKALLPVLNRLATEFSNQVKIVKVDIDAAPELAEQFDVESVPTLILFRGGRIVEEFLGAPPAHQLREILMGMTNPKSAAAVLNAPWLKS